MPSVYAHETGWIGPCATGARPSRIVRAIELAIERVEQRAPHAHVGKRRHLPLVQRHVLVGVAGRLVDDDRRHRREISRNLSHGTSATTCTSPLFSWLMRVLVLATNRNISRRMCRILGAAPVVGHALEQDVFAGLPLRDAIGAGAERIAVVVLRAIDVAPLEHVLRQHAADELHVVRRVDLA